MVSIRFEYMGMVLACPCLAVEAHLFQDCLSSLRKWGPSPHPCIVSCNFLYCIYVQYTIHCKVYTYIYIWGFLVCLAAGDLYQDRYVNGSPKGPMAPWAQREAMFRDVLVGGKQTRV